MSDSKNRKILIDELINDPNFVFLVQYNYKAVTIGPSARVGLAGLSAQYRLRPEETTGEILELVAKTSSTRWIENAISDDTEELSPRKIIEITNKVINELFLAACVDGLIMKLTKHDVIKDYSTEHDYKLAYSNLAKTCFNISSSFASLEVNIMWSANYSVFSDDPIKMRKDGRTRIEVSNIGTDKTIISEFVLLDDVFDTLKRLIEANFNKDTIKNPRISYDW